jgi:hypothetical protein
MIVPAGAMVCFASLFLSATILRAQYTGSEACRFGHAARSASQSSTGHAHAFIRNKTDKPGQWAFGAGAKAIT